MERSTNYSETNHKKHIEFTGVSSDSFRVNSDFFGVNSDVFRVNSNLFKVNSSFFRFWRSINGGNYKILLLTQIPYTSH